jgi:hypothetical protein
VVWGNNVEREQLHRGVEELLDAGRDENSGE